MPTPKRLIYALSVLSAFALLLAANGARADFSAWDKVTSCPTGKLDAAQKSRVIALLESLSNTRGCQGTLASCVKKSDLTASRHAGFVCRMVRRGKDDAFIAAGIEKRHRSAFPEQTHKIDLKGHPRRGALRAKVQLVEYACFECPFCAHLFPKTKRLEKSLDKKLATFYKFFPVRSHKRGVPAAQAAIAAQKQQKFWEMAALLFKNRSDLEDDDLARYAKELGLDMAEFERDRASADTMRFIERDKLEGMRLGVEGTPTFFVNGKKYLGPLYYEEILDRLQEELDIVEGRIK